MYRCKIMEKLLWKNSGKNVGKHYGKNKIFDFYGVMYIVRKVILCRVMEMYFVLRLGEIYVSIFLFTKKDLFEKIFAFLHNFIIHYPQYLHYLH